jgi:hypothetical protein
VFDAIYLDVLLVYMRDAVKRKKMRGGTHFMVAISLRIFSSGNASRGVNGMRITHFSSVTPSPERKTTGKQML